MADGIRHGYDDGGQEYVQKDMDRDKPVQDWNQKEETQNQADMDQEPLFGAH